jgi:hypothetical protein
MDDNISVNQEELAQLEKDILNSVPVEDQKDEPKPKANAEVVNKIPPKSTKKMIQDDIIKISKELGKDIPTVRWFKKQKKAQLEEHLKLLVAELAEKATVGKLQEKAKEQMLKDPSKSIECRSLYNANFILCNMLEKASVALKDKTFNVAVLEGWSQDIYDSRDQLMIIYAEIIDKYGNQITQYVDPFAKLGLVMLTSAASCAAKNIKNKESDVKKK